MCVCSMMCVRACVRAYAPVCVCVECWATWFAQYFAFYTRFLLKCTCMCACVCAGVRMRWVLSDLVLSILFFYTRFLFKFSILQSNLRVRTHFRAFESPTSVAQPFLGVWATIWSLLDRTVPSLPQALRTSPVPHQKAFVCEACTGTAQIGVSLFAPLDSFFKQSTLRCWGVCLMWYLWHKCLMSCLCS